MRVTPKLSSHSANACPPSKRCKVALSTTTISPYSRIAFPLGCVNWLASWKKLKKPYCVACPIKGIGLHYSIKYAQKVRRHIWRLCDPRYFCTRLSFHRVSVLRVGAIWQFETSFIEKLNAKRIRSSHEIDVALAISDVIRGEFFDR